MPAHRDIYHPFARLWAPVFLALALLLFSAGAAQAQIELLSADAAPETPTDPEPVIEAPDTAPDDANIETRIEGIFAEIPALSKIGVTARRGVVTLSGEVPTLEDSKRAEAIAARVAGVVTVESSVERNLDVSQNLAPVLERMKTGARDLLKSLPLLAVALVIIAIAWILGGFLSRRTKFWQTVAPNIFLAELFAVGFRFIFLLIGMFVALDVLGATAVMGALLGSAGVIGLAIGFAVRDTIENYVSSIMLSIRQPFRANDHVLIGQNEGRIIRLTSRATILMTLDGNHLRIPNSTVYKAEILNYTRNPERRFEFEMGIDADDDPADAIATGLAALKDMPFVLDEPKATARIEQVGDSNIVIKFLGWVDQREADFYKARSAGIRVVKNVLEDAGFGLPEPIYRLRFDGRSDPLEIARSSRHETEETKTAQSSQKASAKPAKKIASADMDVSKDDDIEQKVAEERAQSGEKDILDSDSPIE